MADAIAQAQGLLPQFRASVKAGDVGKAKEQLVRLKVRVCPVVVARTHKLLSPSRTALTTKALFLPPDPPLRRC